MTEALDPATRVGLAVDQAGLVHGVTSWLPIYTAFRNEAATVVSLSGAPLARSARPAADTAIGRLMDSLGAALEPVYGFPLALAFKMPR